MSCSVLAVLGVRPAAGSRESGCSFRTTASTILVLGALGVALDSSAALLGKDIEEARKLFAAGDYAECEREAAEATEKGRATEDWHLLKLRSQLAVADHEAALKTLEAALRAHPGSIRLRWLGRLAFLGNGEVKRAEKALVEIESLLRRAPWRYRDPDSQVIVGRFLLERGADARQVLEAIYDRLKKEQPGFVEAHVAAGDLALEKHDYGVAVEEFEGALELAPNDPAIFFRLAKAQGVGGEQLGELEQALKRFKKAKEKQGGKLY